MNSMPALVFTLSAGFQPTVYVAAAKMASSMQSPMLHPPTKRTDEVDFTGPFRAYIQSAYSDDPDKYTQEIGTLHRLRQDTRGAGKDITGRDILYRYYGQLELLDLRFPIDEKNVKILFTWYDAFSGKSISQYSIAYEKACVIFNVAATCCSIAALQNRFDQAGLKMAFNYFQAAAGLFAYINDNFLHAPSVDLSRDSIKTLVDLCLGQAQECFVEKVILEKKKGALVAKLAAQAAHVYNNVVDGLSNESVKGQFEKPWVDLVKIKAKYFQAVSFYHKGIQLESESKWGESVAHLTHAETVGKEANKLANSFASNYPSFTTATMNPTTGGTTSSSGQPTTAAAALQEATKVMLNWITEKKNAATRDNDLIYHDAVPNADTLPPIEKLNLAKCITFAEVCTNGQADIPKIVGADIFQRLVPLSVHEAASRYSEEKAKILRAQQELVENANGELQASLDSMNLIPTLDKLKKFVKGMSGLDEGFALPDQVRSWVATVRAEEGGDGGASNSGTSSDELLGVLDGLKKKVQGALDEVGLLLDKEQHDCEGMRVKYMNQWKQEPSAKLTSHMRQDIRQHRESYEKALSTDQTLLARLKETRADIDILKRPIEEVESIFAERIMGAAGTPNKPKSGPNLMDENVGEGGLGVLGEQLMFEKLDNILNRLRALKKERVGLVEELKAKNKENQVFQSELAKYKPYEQRIGANAQAHAQLIQDLSNEFAKLKETSKGMKMLESRERKKAEILRDWRRSFEHWRESKEGIKRGVQFYSDLSDLVDTLKTSVVSFVNRRTDERNQLVKSIEEEHAERGQRALREQLQRLSVSSASPTSSQPSLPTSPPPVPAPYGAPMAPPATQYAPQPQQQVTPTAPYAPPPQSQPLPGPTASAPYMPPTQAPQTQQQGATAPYAYSPAQSHHPSSAASPHAPPPLHIQQSSAPPPPQNFSQTPSYSSQPLSPYQQALPPQPPQPHPQPSVPTNGPPFNAGQPPSGAMYNVNQTPPPVGGTIPTSAPYSQPPVSAQPPYVTNPYGHQSAPPPTQNQPMYGGAPYHTPPTSHAQPQPYAYAQTAQAPALPPKVPNAGPGQSYVSSSQPPIPPKIPTSAVPSTLYTSQPLTVPPYQGGYQNPPPPQPSQTAQPQRPYSMGPSTVPGTQVRLT
ncbi:bck1-like resistance to osmotic shock [Quaeritorhiza haematococci]|nr:bck1-like resistance to osmotic shock [Quaeritorhiza haematococci]